MKLLIVDDEKHVINVIRCLIPAKQLGITEILSAQTAAEAKILLEKERPEIACIDIILHNQTGMNLMAFIINRRLPTQVIAISGHADYEYVRTMLLNGAVDYLLKPVESKALTASLQKAIQRLSAAPAAVPQEQPAMNTALSTQYLRTQLRKMLTPENAASVYNELAALDGQFANVAQCAVLYYDLRYLPMRSVDFRHHLNLFEEKVKAYLSLQKCGFFLDKFSSQQEQLILLISDVEEHLRQIENIASKVFAATAFAFHMGCASGDFAGQFAQCCEQAQSCFFADDCYMTPELIQKRVRMENDAETAPAGLARRLLSLIIVQDLKALEKEATQWISAVLGTERVSLHRVKSVIDAYNAMHADWLARIREIYPDFGYEKIAEPISYMDFLDEYYVFSPQMMTADIQRSLKLFAECLSRVSTETDVLKQIAFYMELNYDQPFNQVEYAQMFHINRDYLSRKFKQTFGEGMVSYLNRLRISHAERLLHDPSLKIRNIAYMTGFSDEKYFARQFKELTHVTPSEYRTMLQVEELDS